MSGKIEAGWRDRVDLHRVNLHEVPRGKIVRQPERVLLNLYQLRKSHMIRRLGVGGTPMSQPLDYFYDLEPND